MEEDEPTTRMDLEALQVGRMLQAPLAEQTPLVTVAGPLPQPAVRPRALSRHAKIGAGLFLLGVLVGVGGAVAALASRAAPAPSAALATPVPTSLPAVDKPLPKPAAVEPKAIEPKAVEPKAVELAAPPAATAAPIPEKVVEAAEPEPKLAALPISSARVPNCQQLLGEPPVKRQSTIAAARETTLANRQLLLGNVAMAQAAYCNAFALDQANVDRHVNLARVYLVRRDWEKAAELGQSGLKLSPNNRGALGVLGDAWAALNKSDKARKMMLAAEGKPQATPKELDLIVKRNLALAQRVAQKNDFLLAERLYRRVLLVDPHQADAMSGVAKCLLKAGDFKAAEAWARRAKQLKSGR